MKVNLMRTEDFLSFALIFERQSCYVLGPPRLRCRIYFVHDIFVLRIALFAEMASARRPQATDRRFAIATAVLFIVTIKAS